MHKIGPLEKLGTVWWFEFFDVDPAQSPIIERRLIGEMDRFNATYSRFLSDSLLSRLNQTGQLAQIDVEFHELLSIALTAYHDTRGVFNIAIGKRLEASGYDAAYSFASADELPAVPALPEVLSLTDTSVELKTGTHLDLGGFGKGYLIDRLAQLLQTEGYSQQFLINGGGDMYATDNGGKAITINLANPHNSNKFIGSLPLFHIGFAASSPYLRQWQSKGKKYHHLIGNEAACSTFVIGTTATEADIWSTALAIDSTLTPPPSVRWWQWTETESLRQPKQSNT